jgi:hypothetical protein
MKYAFFLVLASLLGAACSDSPVANAGTVNQGNPPPDPVPANSALSGRILVRGIGAARVVELRDDHGDVFRLLGSETIALANVDGGDAVVWGTWDASPGLVVSKFKLTGMNGRPALDGVLEATDEGFSVRLNDGSFRGVPGLSAECVAYLGARVWVVGFEDGTDVELGMIRRAIAERPVRFPLE